VQKKKDGDGKARGRVHSDDSAGADGDEPKEPRAPHDPNPSVRYEIDVENSTPNARDDAFDRLEQLQEKAGWFVRKWLPADGRLVTETAKPTKKKKDRSDPLCPDRIEFASLNVNSWASHREEISSFLSVGGVHLFAAQEVHGPATKTSDHTLAGVAMPGHTVFNAPCKQGDPGSRGVLLAVSETFQAWEFVAATTTVVAVVVDTGSRPPLVVSVHVPTRARRDAVARQDTLEHIDAVTTKNSKRRCLMGKCSSWGT